MVEALLIAIAWMVYAIGYSLSVAALLFLHRNDPENIRPTDFVVLLFWPIAVPVVLSWAIEDAFAKARSPHTPPPAS